MSNDDRNVFDMEFKASDKLDIAHSFLGQPLSLVSIELPQGGQKVRRDRLGAEDRNSWFGEEAPRRKLD
jgi:hypothetical protein